jgi:hypothetical protein
MLADSIERSDRLTATAPQFFVPACRSKIATPFSPASVMRLLKRMTAIGDWLGNGNSRCDQEIDWSRGRWHEVSL